MHILSFNQSTDAERQGAIKRDTLVLAKLENIQGKCENALARVVEATMISARGESKKRFKYYVTYEGENRRMDRWLQQDELVTDSSEINKAVKQKDKLARKQETTELFENDENKGMDKK